MATQYSCVLTQLAIYSSPRKAENHPGERSDSPRIALAEQITEAQRELALRKKCYPAWVKSGKLEAGDAKYQILVQEELAYA
jgi:hypothetical protein